MRSLGLSNRANSKGSGVAFKIGAQLGYCQARWVSGHIMLFALDQGAGPSSYHAETPGIEPLPPLGDPGNRGKHSLWASGGDLKGKRSHRFPSQRRGVILSKEGEMLFLDGLLPQMVRAQRLDLIRLIQIFSYQSFTLVLATEALEVVSKALSFSLCYQPMK